MRIGECFHKIWQTNIEVVNLKIGKQKEFFTKLFCSFLSQMFFF